MFTHVYLEGFWVATLSGSHANFYIRSGYKVLVNEHPQGPCRFPL
jgi:predicted RNA binding protein YcfA (HicA-like mRNA interferase family)